MTDNGLQTITKSALTFSTEQVQMLKDNYAKGATNEEFKVFIEIAKHNRLDPFKNQIYLIPRYDSKLKRQVFKPLTSIEGLRAKADETGVYGGSQVYWCGEDSEWLEVWLSEEPPAAAKAVVWKIGSEHPFVHVAKFVEYVVLDRNNKPTPMWKKMAANQLGKCAESGALRKGFPDQCAGLYVREEMEQAGYGVPEMDAGTAKPAPDARVSRREAPPPSPSAPPVPAAVLDEVVAYLFVEGTEFPPTIEYRGHTNPIRILGSHIHEKLGWGDAPIRDKDRSGILAECDSLGYSESEQRHALFAALYAVLDVEEQLRLLDLADWTAGHGKWFMDLAPMMRSRSEGEPYPKAMEVMFSVSEAVTTSVDADDDLSADLDLEDEEDDFFVN